jgi:hypothetical protein
VTPSPLRSLDAEVAETRARAERAEAKLRHYRHYAHTYGNAESECAAGYPQQSGLICGLCQHDNSDGSPCPRAALEAR